MKQVIHKACSPKRNYANPTWCIARLSEQDAHKFSSVRWSYVTCRKCLLKRGKRSPW